MKISLIIETEDGRFAKSFDRDVPEADISLSVDEFCARNVNAIVAAILAKLRSK